MKQFLFLLIAFAVTFSSPLFAQKRKADSTQSGVKPEIFELSAPQRILVNPSNTNARKKQRSSNFNTLSGSKLAGLTTLKGKFDNLSVVSGDNKTPIFIKASPLESNNARYKSKTPTEAATSYLNDLQDVLHIKNIDEELDPLESPATDHVRFLQSFHGLPVYGGQLVVHLKNGTPTSLNGRFFPTPEIETIASITKEEAINDTKLHLSNITPILDLSEEQKHILDYSGPVSELVIYYTTLASDPKLTWHITLRPNFVERYEYFIDAQSGIVLNYYNHTCADGPATANATDLNGDVVTINTYQVGATHYMIDGSNSMFKAPPASDLPDDPVGAIWTIDAMNTEGSSLEVEHVTSIDNTWNQANAVSAHNHASIAYDYFQDTHGRNSINGRGGTIISIVNVGTDFENAYWNGSAMFYGNGDQAFDDLAGSLDVGGHEMTHGVISNTANLEYQGESGAINESFADIFGAMMDREDWQIGEDITNTSYISTGALRDLSNPHNGGNDIFDPGYQPEHVNEQYTGSADNGGVHINSGITNRAYYLFATEIGKTKAEIIYYLALTEYLTSYSQFIDLRLAVIAAAEELHGQGSPEAVAAGNAFDTVGILGSGGGTTNPNNDLPMNTGDQGILFADLDPFVESVLAIVDNDGTNYRGVTTTSISNTPNVTDDGRYCIFVAGDNTIREIDLNDNNNEYEISPQPIWYNVANSRVGDMFAAVTLENDSSIHVYNYGLAEWKTFKLYNPTFTEGVRSFEVVYADALEWDFSGEYIMYDAFNEIENPNGENISYFDIGFIKVWDNATNTWGSGEIEKLFSTIPEGIDIGYPTFSKNSPDIIAFDYVDQDIDEYIIYGANLSTGDLEVIYENNTWGIPSYSPDDDELAFIANDNLLATINLNPDKITSVAGSGVGIRNDATFPEWFAKGSRILAVNDEVETGEVKVYPNPTLGGLTLELTLNNPGTVHYEVIDLMGKTLLRSSELSLATGIHQETLSLEGFQAGQYMIKVYADGNSFTKRVVLIQ